MSTLLEFYGNTCPHCIQMKPLVERLEKEKGVQVKKLEIYDNQANAAKMNELSEGKCMGVPFFINTETGAFLCGEADYEELKAWIKK